MSFNRNVVPIIDAIRDARFIHGLACVHCGARRIQRWGRFSGRQRYRCGSCSRTFSDLTGTAARYLKKIDRVVDYLARMPEARSVRREACRIGIDKDTALRWRHRLLDRAPLYGELVSAGICGIVEVTESKFSCVRRPRSASRRMGRVSPVTIVTMRDRRRLTYQERCAASRVLSREFEAISVLISPGSTVVSDAGRLCPIATALRRRTLKGTAYFYQSASKLTPVRPILYHTRNVSAFVRREKRWLKRFRGVTRRWLHVYLSWFEMVDPTTRAPSCEELLMWPMLLE